MPSRVNISSSRACDPPVEDVGVAHAARTACTHEATLGIIPPVTAPDGEHGLELVGRDGPDQAGGVADVGQQAVDVGQVDELLGRSASATAPATVSALML